MKVKAVFFGGSLFKRLIPFISTDDVEVCEIFFMNPLDDCACVKSEKKEALFSILRDSHADYIFIELSSIRIPLENNESYSERDYEKKIENFVSVIREFFDEKHIVLISSIPSKWYVSQNKIKNYFFSQTTKLIEKAEKEFKKNIECCTIKLTDKYFFEMKNINPNMNIFNFEDRFFVDLNNKIVDFVSGKNIEYSQINPKFALEKVINHYNSLYTKSFYEFLNKDYLSTKLILSLSNSFLEANFEIFQFIINKSYSEFELLNYFLCNSSKEVYDVCFKCIYILKNEDLNYNDDYEDIFRLKLNIIDRMITILEKEYSNIFNIPHIHKKINKENIKIFYNIIQLRKRNFINDVLANELINKFSKGVAVDIIGSCVSRHPINFCKNVFSKYYNWHINCLNFDIKEKTLKGLPQPTNWEQRVLIEQLNGSAIKKYSESYSEIAVVDFWQFTSKNNYLFTNDDKKHIFTIVDSLTASYYSEWLKPIDKSILQLFSVGYIKENLRDFIDFLRKRYTKIILINCTQAEYFIFNNTLYPFKEYQSKVIEDNKKLKEIESFFINELIDKVYYVDISKYFFSDDKSDLGIMPMHYETEYYEEIGKIIDLISANEIDIKVFDNYSIKTKLKRIARLNAVPENKKLMYKSFNQDFLDRYICDLPSNFILENIEELAKWCLIIKNKEQLLSFSESTNPIIKKIIEVKGE